MLRRLVDVSESHRCLTVRRGLLEVRDGDADGTVVGAVPLDDIEALVVHAEGVTYQHRVLRELSVRGVPVVVCNPTHVPVSILWPLDGHHEVARRLDAQCSASLPLQKRLWASIVRQKVAQQASVLASRDADGAAKLRVLAGRVRSGDADNREAVAAQLYWPRLFGHRFTRQRGTAGVNGLLNYGYAVLRAVTARAVVAAGLHPAMGIHHSHDANPFRLVDDLMEVWRPFVDRVVASLDAQAERTLTRPAKARLVATFYVDVQIANDRTPLVTCIHRLATSLALVYLGRRTTLDFPPVGPPLEDAGADIDESPS
jgi:CRISPR-associated protein Cas1